MYGASTCCKNLVVGPSSADSANSVHGCFSRVQNANGISLKVKTQQLLAFSEFNTKTKSSVYSKLLVDKGH